MRHPAPAFDPAAHGRPSDWNDKRARLFWGRSAKRRFKDAPAAVQPDVNTILELLRTRLGADGRPVLDLLGPPVAQGDGWTSFARLGFTAEEQASLEEKGWERAWHGCKFEAVYSILYHGQLHESRDQEQGDRFLSGAPGVYVHKEGTSQKAENYIRFTPLCGDGVFWAAKWELRVDREDRVIVPRKTDQWVQRARSVHLAALWVCGRAKEDMREGDAVSQRWVPELEANPADGIWKHRAAVERQANATPDNGAAELAPQPAAKHSKMPRGSALLEANPPANNAKTPRGICKRRAAEERQANATPVNCAAELAPPPAAKKLKMPRGSVATRKSPSVQDGRRIFCWECEQPLGETMRFCFMCGAQQFLA